MRVLVLLAHIFSYGFFFDNIFHILFVVVFFYLFWKLAQINYGITFFFGFLLCAQLSQISF